MSVLLEKEMKPAVKGIEAITAQAKSKGARKKPEEDDDLGNDDDAPVKKGSAKKGADDDDDIDDDDTAAEDEDDDWDPDFEEFDLPKSKGGKGDKEPEEEEDFKVTEDDDLKELELFNDSASDDEEDDY